MSEFVVNFAYHSREYTWANIKKRHVQIAHAAQPSANTSRLDILHKKMQDHTPVDN